MRNVCPQVRVGLDGLPQLRDPGFHLRIVQVPVDNNLGGVDVAERELLFQHLKPCTRVRVLRKNLDAVEAPVDIEVVVRTPRSSGRRPRAR